jgi:hypothetical protein
VTRKPAREALAHRARRVTRRSSLTTCDQSQSLRHSLNNSQGLCIGATPSVHLYSAYCASHFDRHASFDWAFCVDVCEGWLSSPDAETVNANTSPIAKDHNLTMTGRLAPCGRVDDAFCRCESEPKHVVQTIACGDGLQQGALGCELSRPQAGDTRGLPFSTTYVIARVVGLSPFLPPWGLREGTWNPSPALKVRAPSPSTFKSNAPSTT